MIRSLRSIPGRHRAWFLAGVVILLFGAVAVSVTTWRSSTASWVGMWFNPGDPEAATGSVSPMPAFRPGAVLLVWPGGPADRAGIQPGDEVVSIQGVAIADPDAFDDPASLSRGGEATYEIRRGGEILRVPVSQESPLGTGAFLLALLTSLALAGVFAATGTMVFLLRAADRRAALFFFLCANVASLWLTTSALTVVMAIGPGVVPRSFSPTTAAIFVSTMFVGMLLGPLLLHFSMVFPRERPLLREHPRVLRLVYGLVFVPLLVPVGMGAVSTVEQHTLPESPVVPLSSAFLLVPLLLWIGGGLVRSVVRGGWRAVLWDRPLPLLLFAFLGILWGSLVVDTLPLPSAARGAAGAILLVPIVGLVALTPSVVYPLLTCFVLYRGYRDSGAEERAQVRWPLWGTITALAGYTLLSLVGAASGLYPTRWTTPLSILIDSGSKLVLLLLPVSFAVAILKYRLLDIEILIRKTAVYSILTGAVILLYLFLAGGVGGLVVRFARVESEWVVIASTLGVALVLVPVRTRIQRFVDRRFFRERFEYPQALEQLARGLREVRDRSRVAATAIGPIQQAVRSRAVAVFLASDGSPTLHLAAKIGLRDEARRTLLLPAETLADVRAPVEISTFPDLTEVRRRARAELVVPVRRDGTVLGAVTLASKLSGAPFGEEDRRFLEDAATQLAEALERLHLRARGAEVDNALEIQRHLLPERIPQPEGFEIATSWLPSRTVAGDSYDVLQLDDGRIGLCIADASGKGIPAALLMSNLQAAVRTLAPGRGSPAALARQLNQILAGNVALGKYVTFFYAVLDPASRELVYTNAGHNRPIVLRAEGTEERLAAGGMALGLFPDRSYEEERVVLRPGDRLLLFTDGLTEAAGADGEEFGEERLLGAVARTREGSAADIVRAVVERVAAFSPGERADDQTLLVVTAV